MGLLHVNVLEGSVGWWGCRKVDIPDWALWAGHVMPLTGERLGRFW